MTKLKFIIGMCIVFSLLSVFTLASEELNSVSRIVGESPSEMIKQLQQSEIEIGHATYYSSEILHTNNNDEILELFLTK